MAFPRDRAERKEKCQHVDTGTVSTAKDLEQGLEVIMEFAAQGEAGRGYSMCYELLLSVRHLFVSQVQC